jgi:hypothetical protein
VKNLPAGLLLITLVLLNACKTSFTGELKPNEPPESYCVVDTIIRAGDDRLNSQVQLYWWGNDGDGFISGYEFTFESVITPATQWSFTTRQDSTFLLATPPGSDTADFDFYLRAVDNAGERDATPVHLVIPVKNSKPSVAFVYAENFPARSFPVVRFYWQGNDPDGEENLRRFELCWNDTTLPVYPLDFSVTSAIFAGINLQSNLSDCEVFANNNPAAESALMSGLRLNDTNVLFIRAVDKAEAVSAFAPSLPVYIKQPVSELLLVDGYSSNGSAIESFYTEQLTAVGFPVVDTLQIFEKQNGVYTQQSADQLTQSKVFSLFKTIVWFTNDASGSLSIGQRTLNEFFDEGGKLLMSVYVSSLFDEQSGFLDFTPIQSFVVPDDTTLILTDTSAVTSLQQEFPDLLSTAFVGVVRPFVPVVGAAVLYDAQLIAKDNNNLLLSDWQGISSVMAKKPGSNGETNFIISTIELHKLDGLMNMAEFFDSVMNFEFKP